MTIDTRLPATSAEVPTVPTFGTASVRLLAPQFTFEMVRAAAAASQGGSVGVLWPAPTAAANQNIENQRSSAA
jgi:hypothetical protein